MIGPATRLNAASTITRGQSRDAATLFALAAGAVQFDEKRGRNTVNIVPSEA